MNKSVEDEKVDTAFGFQTLCAGGIVRARSMPHYGKTRKQSEEEKDSVEHGIKRLGVRPVLQSGLQDVPRQRQMAAIQGRVARLLDMSNEQEHLVIASVTRLVAELVVSNYEKEMIISALDRMRENAWCSLKECKLIAIGRKNEAQAYIMTYDAMRITQAEQDRAMRRIEQGIAE